MIADRWGVSDAEVARAYPCDAFVTGPTLQAWRGVTVAAPVEKVWPWVNQIRVAPYSYDWIDNLGRRSPRRRVELPAPEVGAPFTRALGGRPLGRIVAAEAPVHLTGEILGAFMSYVLVPHGSGRSRLLLKLVSAHRQSLVPLICVGDLVMASKQLRTLGMLAAEDPQRP